LGPAEDPRTRELLRAVREGYHPNKVLAWLDPASPDAPAIPKRIPLLAEKQLLNGDPTAYLCKNYACQAPTTDPETLRRQLAGVGSTGERTS